jgi:hypothetical protein
MSRKPPTAYEKWVKDQERKALHDAKEKCAP